MPSTDGTAEVPVLATGIGLTLRRKLHVKYKAAIFEIDAAVAE